MEGNKKPHHTLEEGSWRQDVVEGVCMWGRVTGKSQVTDVLPIDLFLNVCVFSANI